ncbi:uncharacterized membrane protein YciS (DUF1049 family) [Nocardioides luteus]|uniref:Uncharacterized protein n=1 Tax=Nocardioides luteus TaxID=1844 RepID=A0ABQ5SW14_9ACTN|nr:hypothetical protein [Nocardioides luteus]MDR7312136.1 uncharacterized membrane protein YciS (DUF1049 family) [Nocardioides luteus]GGR56277.1 hypothetical protein GCM10010197_23600 [Nocardioides luteus]GLJ68380.1 hypothetical protein GCM10017579_24160 [Nocardioides luteus]
MKLYADTPVRRVSQLLADLLTVGWVVGWVLVGRLVHKLVSALAVPGEKMDDAGTSLSAKLLEAAGKVDDLPLVKDGIAAPFEGAAKAADQLRAAGEAQVEAVASIAIGLAVAVVAVPVLMWLMVYLPLRLRFIRRATSTQRFLQSGTGADLVALRAMSTQPLHKLVRISDDPVRAWREGDAEVVARLAELELRSVGLSAKRL